MYSLFPIALQHEKDYNKDAKKPFTKKESGDTYGTRFILHF